MSICTHDSGKAKENPRAVIAKKKKRIWMQHFETEFLFDYLTFQSWCVHGIRQKGEFAVYTLCAVFKFKYKSWQNIPGTRSCNSHKYVVIVYAGTPTRNLIGWSVRFSGGASLGLHQIWSLLRSFTFITTLLWVLDQEHKLTCFDRQYHRLLREYKERVIKIKDLNLLYLFTYVYLQIETKFGCQVINHQRRNTI